MVHAVYEVVYRDFLRLRKGCCLERYLLEVKVVALLLLVVTKTPIASIDPCPTHVLQCRRHDSPSVSDSEVFAVLTSPKTWAILFAKCIRHILMHFCIRMSDALSAPHSSADIPGQDRESKQKRKGINT